MKAQVLALAVLAGACAQEADQTASPQAPVSTAPSPSNAEAPAASERAVIPAVFHGRWNASGTCVGDSDPVLTVSADQLLFREAVGKLVSVTPRGPDAIRVDVDFVGQGETWPATVEFSLASDTLTITQPNGSSGQVRCR